MLKYHVNFRHHQTIPQISNKQPILALIFYVGINLQSNENMILEQFYSLMANKIVHNKYQQMDQFYEMLKIKAKYQEDYISNYLIAFNSYSELFIRDYAKI